MQQLIQQQQQQTALVALPMPGKQMSDAEVMAANCTRGGDADGNEMINRNCGGQHKANVKRRRPTSKKIMHGSRSRGGGGSRRSLVVRDSIDVYALEVALQKQPPLELVLQILRGVSIESTACVDVEHQRAMANIHHHRPLCRTRRTPKELEYNHRFSPTNNDIHTDRDKHTINNTVFPPICVTPAFVSTHNARKNKALTITPSCSFSPHCTYSSVPPLSCLHTHARLERSDHSVKLVQHGMDRPPLGLILLSLARVLHILG